MRLILFDAAFLNCFVKNKSPLRTIQCELDSYKSGPDESPMFSREEDGKQQQTN